TNPRTPLTRTQTHARTGRGPQRKIVPPASNLANVSERLGAPAFERICSTQFAGEFQPAGEPIDGDDRIAACDPRRHQPGEADPADPVNRDRLTGGGLHHIPHRPGTRLQTTTPRP